MFFTEEDRTDYLDWLKEYCEKHRVEILAYCLMTHHIHLVAGPETEKGLQGVLKPLHMRYAQRVNRARGWKGHVWQGRFFSSPLDEGYLWAAIRYVERNPVRAEMVLQAEEYSWSSAAAHCGLKDDQLLSQRGDWTKQREQIADWSSWLAEGDKPQALEVLRRNVEKGLSCGTEKFVQSLEKIAGKVLQYRPIGRPSKEKG
ncbi:MAG: transposase [Pseudomonadota bacterium]